MTLQGLWRRQSRSGGLRGLGGGQWSGAGLGGGLSRMALLFPATPRPSRLLPGSNLGFLFASDIA